MSTTLIKDLSIYACYSMISIPHALGLTTTRTVEFLQYLSGNTSLALQTRPFSAQVQLTESSERRVHEIAQRLGIEGAVTVYKSNTFFPSPSGLQSLCYQSPSCVLVEEVSGDLFEGEDSVNLTERGEVYLAQQLAMLKQGEPLKRGIFEVAKLIVCLVTPYFKLYSLAVYVLISITQNWHHRHVVLEADRTLCDVLDIREPLNRAINEVIQWRQGAFMDFNPFTYLFKALLFSSDGEERLAFLSPEPLLKNRLEYLNIEAEA